MVTVIACNIEGGAPGTGDFDADPLFTAPETLDSGRNCSPRNLGSMVGRGITEVRFAGGLWELGSRSGVSLAVFRADGLTSAILFDFYEAGARTAPKTEQTESRDTAVAGIPARRLDTLNDDSYQTVITWPGRYSGWAGLANMAQTPPQRGQAASRRERLWLSIVQPWLTSSPPSTGQGGMG